MQEEEEGNDSFIVVTFFSGFFWKAEGDGSCRPFLFVLFCCSKKKKKATTTKPSSLVFLEGKRELSSLSFCFVLLQEEGDGSFVAVTFFSGFFLEGRRGW